MSSLNITMPAAAAGTRGLPDWIHAATALLFLLVVAVFDVTKVFGRSWSIFYLLPVAYTAWTMRTRAEWVVHGAVVATVFLAPSTFRPALLWSGTGVFNRSLGVILGAAVVLFMWERRRHADALQRANDELERRVALRTAELEAANHALSAEMAERRLAETDQRRLTDQLQQAQKMEAIGVLAGSAAHDFNNWLAVIIGYCGVLKAGLPQDSVWQQTVDEIQAAGGQASKLTHQLLALGRRQAMQARVVDLNQVITRAEGLIRRALREDIELELMLHPSEPLITIDEGQLGQVLLNLTNNARDAMPVGGTFQIRTEPVMLSGEDAARLPGLTAGSHVRLTLSDTGHGLDERTRRHVFEPFFTTKAPGAGTGLGLASVYGIIKQSGGHIDVASEPGRGATFTIHLRSASGPSSGS